MRGAAAAEPTVGYQPRTTSITGFPNQSVMKVPQAVAVVSSTVIEDQHARSLDDVLSNVSGIVQTNTLGGTRDAFIKRGFGNNDDGSILVDGMRSPVLHNYLAAIDRVEVLKGPTSLLYGVQEPGGVINLITRKPEDEYSGSISASKTNHGGAGGSFDLTGPIGGAGQVAGGTLAFRLTGEDNTSQYWRTFGRERDSLIAPALSWHDARTSIEIRYQYADYTTPFDRGTVLVNGRLDDALASRRYEEAWAQSTGIQEMFQAKVEHQLSDNWRVRAAYSWGRDRYGQYITRATAFNSATGALTRTADANLGRNDSNQIASIGLLGNLTLGGIRNDLYFGTEYERRREFRGDTIRGTATKGFTIFDPVYGLLPPGVVPSATQSDNLWKTHTYSFMAQDNVHLTGRLTAVAGIRLENWQQFAGQGRPFVVADDSHGHVWLPTLGLVYALTPGLSAYVNTSRSFVPNSSVDGLAPLPPTTGRSVETGLKFELNHSLTGTLALYQIDKRNVAVTVNGVSQTIGAARSARCRARPGRPDHAPLERDRQLRLHRRDRPPGQRAAGQRGAPYRQPVRGLRHQHRLAAGPMALRRRRALRRPPRGRYRQQLHAARLCAGGCVRRLRDQDRQVPDQGPAQRQQPVQQGLLPVEQQQPDHRRGRAAPRHLDHHRVVLIAPGPLGPGH